MPNARAKGKRAEAEAAALAEKLGYLVYRPPSVKYQIQDLFDFGDCLLVNDFEAILVQVKTDQTTSHFSKREQGRLASKVPNGLLKQLWVRKVGGGFERFYWDDDSSWVLLEETDLLVDKKK